MIGSNIYKGFRYVPKNEGDWNKNKSYEALTVVQYQGNSYTSKICVPIGIEITDNKFWVQTANYNQQFETLRDTFNTTTSETIKALNDFKSKQDNEFADLLEQHKSNVNAYVDEMSANLEAEREELNKGGMTDLQNQINNKRIFKPSFGIQSWTGGVDSNGNDYTTSLESFKETFNKFKEMKIDEYCFNLTINPGDMHLIQDINIIKQAFEYATSIDFKIKCVKLHFLNDTITDELINSYGVEQFFDTYKNIITTIASNVSCEYMGVFNECDVLINNISYENKVIEIIEYTKTLGFKVGMPTKGINMQLKMSQNICSKVDIFMVNHYQSITNTGSCTPSQSLETFKASKIHSLINYLTTNYKNKKIIITETGVQDYLIALSSPALSSWGDAPISNGEAPYVYLYGLLNSLKESNVLSVWWLYSIDYELTRKLLKEYL